MKINLFGGPLWLVCDTTTASLVGTLKTPTMAERNIEINKNGKTKKLVFLFLSIILSTKFYAQNFKQDSDLIINLNKIELPFNNGRFIWPCGPKADTLNYIFPNRYKVKQIWASDMDPAEIYFQYFKRKYISKTEFDSLIITHKIDTVQLRKNKKNQMLSIFVGLAGKSKHIIIDLNKNYNFLDDSVRIFPDSATNESVYNYKNDEIIKFEYNSLIGGTELGRSINFKIVPFDKSYTFADSSEVKTRVYFAKHEYMAGKFEVEGKKYEVELPRPQGPNYGYEKSYIFFRNSENEYLSYNPPLELNDLVELQNINYKIAEVSFWGEYIVLHKVTKNSEKPIGYREGEYINPVELQSLQDMKNSTFFRKDTYNIDSLYLFDFWGSWCKPCVAKMDSLKSLYLKFYKKVNFIGIAYDKNSESSKKIVEIKKLLWPQYFIKDPLLGTDLISQLKITCFPTYMLIRSDGKIIYRFCGIPISMLEKKLNFALVNKL